MNFMLRALPFIVLVANGFCAFGDVSWTEYFKGSLPSSGTVTISSGDSVVMNDAEMKATESCTVNVSEGAVLKLDTSAPPAFAFGTKCYGTVEKISSASWPVATKNQSNFKGVYVISAGSVKINGTYCKIFGSVDNLDEGKLYIKKGAKLIYNGASAKLGNLRIYLAGEIELDTSDFNFSVFRFLTLEDDASIVLSNSSKAFVDCHSAEIPSCIDLGGHTLSFGGNGKLTLKNGSMKGNGNIVLASGTAAKPYVLTLENFAIEPGAAGDRVEMGDCSSIVTDSAQTLHREVKLSSSNAFFPGPGLTTFAGGLSGAAEDLAVFATNSCAVGMVAFVDGSIANDTQGKTVYDSIDDGALWIGHCATGALCVAGTAAVTNKLVVGGVNNAKKYQVGTGMLLQNGGEVCMIGSSDTSLMRNTSTIGWSAQGTYQLCAGRAEAIGSFVVGMASHGVFMQKGGVFEQKWHPLAELGPYVYMPLQANDNDASDIGSVLCVAGGTMKIGRIMLAHGRNSYAAVTVAGNGSRLESDARIYSGFGGGTFACVNINDGGVLATPYFAYAANVDSPFYVNFDGGTLEVMPSVKGESELLAIFGLAGGAVPMITRVTVGARGAAIDTNGRDMSADVPMTSPEGKVVAAIPFEPERGWTVAPFVKIVDGEGAGAGATAVADFDAANGILKGFIVTSGGWNYTAAKAQVFVGKTCLKEIGCTLADASRSGSFEKKGEGKLTLGAANSWGGETIVSGGELVAACDGAIPEGTALRLEGGVLDLGGHSATFSSIGGTGGRLVGAAKSYTVETLCARTAKSLELGGAELVVTGGLTLDADEILEGEFPTYADADIVFAPGSSITIKDAHKLADSCMMHALLKARSIKGSPALANAAELQGLAYSVRPGRITLGRLRGMILKVK